MAMFNLTRAPIKRGSLVRNAYFGSRIMWVRHIKNDGSVVLRSMGRTYYGEFLLSTRPREVTGVLETPYLVLTTSGKHGHSHGLYQHVVAGDSVSASGNHPPPTKYPDGSYPSIPRASKHFIG